jgi:hypothetical protein
VAQLHRHLGSHQPETVWGLTSRDPDQMDAAQWLLASRHYWGVENGLHQRLDASTNEDRCRVRHPNAIWVLGMFRRLAVSLFVEWRSRDPKRRHTTMTDFQSEMNAEHARRALHFVTARRPSLKDRS